jgi:antitoxin ChpS
LPQSLDRAHHCATLVALFSDEAEGQTMAIVSIRRQGGAAIMTIPADILKTLEVEIGSQLEVIAKGGAFVARPKRKAERRRYSLRELLRGATPDVMGKLNKQTAWAREGGAVGREL